MVEERADKLKRRQLDEPPPGDTRLATVLDFAQIVTRWLKFALQLAAGLAIMVLLVLKVLLAVEAGIQISAPIQLLLRMPTLQIVAQGLMFSAGIELAYMLFTPGPDEAIEPVILGLAAAVLLVVSGDITLSSAASIGILCLAMSLLFWVRGRYVAEAKNHRIEQAERASSAAGAPKKPPRERRKMGAHAPSQPRPAR